MLLCTKRQHGSERMGVPDALSLLNVNDACHLERLMWAVYDGALLVRGQQELPGNHPWCTVLASLYRHIYQGHKDCGPLPAIHAGTARRGLRCCVEEAASAPHGVASGEHPGPALNTAPRHWPWGIGMDAPVAHHLACH